MDRTIPIKDFPDITILGTDDNFAHEVKLINEQNGIYTYKFSATAKGDAASPEAVTLRWRLPAYDIKGVWKCGGIHDKRLRYDWEQDHMQTRISVDAPVISVFGHEDNNRITFACSDAINLIEMNALLREEDNHLYCHFKFFSERHPEIEKYEEEIRIDTRNIPFAKSLQAIATWWEGFATLKPSIAPEVASAPMYSTWYNFHQDLDEALLLKECAIAKDLGYELLLLDDGWQTMDNNRGYDYTGDWEPDRFPDLAGFVQKVHDLGMKFGLWFSVPFCGPKSKAYQRFKGKFLTEDHRWAPVFDPRYPEVRSYLVETYVNALKTYKLDVFKLDFIDDFKVYPETKLTKEDGRDFANVNTAVDKLLTEVMDALRAIKPDIGIEFRQQYVGPALRKFGNMFRAFDCPNDPITNRIRTTDVKLLMGESKVHSDMLTWHRYERVELAAIQVLNGLFSVPQMSILLTKASAEHLNMIKFYTQYWKKNKAVLLDGSFVPKNALANYPILEASANGHTIVGIYDDAIAEISKDGKVDFINAKMSKNIAVRHNGAPAVFHLTTYDCEGNKVTEGDLTLPKGLIEFSVPAAGMMELRIV